MGHCISRARLSSSSWEMGSTRFRKAAFLYRMSLSDVPSRPRSWKRKWNRRVIQGEATEENSLRRSKA